jgi:RimJ/RimL family protein N-acetyltransferase
MSNAKDFVKIRRLLPADAMPLAELCNNKKIWDCLRDHVPFPNLELDALVFIEDCAADEPPVRFAIEYQGVFCGCIGLVPQVDVYRLSAEIGYWLGEPYWGKGIATAAVRLMLEYGFLTLNLERVFAGVFESNEASKKVLLKNGFALDGVFKSALVENNGDIIDEYRFGLTKDEFFKHEEVF